MVSLGWVGIRLSEVPTEQPLLSHKPTIVNHLSHLLQLVNQSVFWLTVCLSFLVLPWSATSCLCKKIILVCLQWRFQDLMKSKAKVIFNLQSIPLFRITKIMKSSIVTEVVGGLELHPLLDCLIRPQTASRSLRTWTQNQAISAMFFVAEKVYYFQQRSSNRCGCDGGSQFSRFVSATKLPSSHRPSQRRRWRRRTCRGRTMRIGYATGEWSLVSWQTRESGAQAFCEHTKRGRKSGIWRDHICDLLDE